MIAEVEHTPFQKLWRVLRLVILAAAFLVVALFALALVLGAWRGDASREEQLEAEGVYVVPHLLYNTYTMSTRFEAKCDEINLCHSAADDICGGATVILSETNEGDGFWLLLAECDAGTDPEW